MATYKVGGEVDVMCTRCKMLLAHTILAIDGARPAGLVKESDFDRLMKGRDFSKNTRYSVKATFKLEDVVDHPTFGLGLVTSVKGPEKVEVLFKDGPKVLAHGRGEPPAT
jgi:hypothetical protein